MVQNLVYSFVFLWAFYVFYVFTMSVYRAKLSDRLDGLSLVLLYPFVVVAALMDVLCNLTIACIVFVEPPQELLVTKRLQRYRQQPEGWRATFAAYICDRLLDPFDPTGNHC